MRGVGAIGSDVAGSDVCHVTPKDIPFGAPICNWRLGFPALFSGVGELKSKKIWEIWKKSKLNSEKIWKIVKKSKLNCEKIWKTLKKGKLNSEMI